MAADILARIEHWFARYGATSYEGDRREAVSAREHALQCAQLAEQAGAEAALVAAALLHDVGHFAAGEDAGTSSDDVDDLHDVRGAALLAHDFPRAVVEPIRLHVAAKRWLTATDAAYAGRLSPASVYSLAQQGGPMNAFERAFFEAQPHSDDAVRLRRWDDLAKRSGVATPPLDYYLALLDEVRLRP